MNNIYLVGNLVADPQTRVISDTLKVANFSIAVEDRVGPRKPKTTSYFDVVAWNKTAEIIVEHFTKGAKLAVFGHVKQETYENKEGKKVSKFTVVADQILNIPARERNTTQAAQSEPVYASTGDDIPF